MLLRVRSINAPACANASGKRPTWTARFSAPERSIEPVHFRSNSNYSLDFHSIRPTNWVKSVQSGLREVKSIWPRPPSRYCIASFGATLSMMRSHSLFAGN